MHWVIFGLAIGLIGVSSYLIDEGIVNYAASCASGSEEGCAALSDCELEAIVVMDATLTKQLSIAGLICVVIFTVIFVIPVDESELAGAQTFHCVVARIAACVVANCSPLVLGDNRLHQL